MYIRTLLLLLLLLTESSALAQTEYPVAPYTDFAYHLGDLLQGSRPLSFYRQSWRAYLETRPGWIFRDGKGINHTDFGGTRLNYGPTFQLLVNAGIKNYRIEIGWGNLHWNETDFYNMLLTKKYAAVLQLGSQYGLTPLIVFNANHGSPCPNLSAKYTLSGAYDATSTSLLLDRVDGIVPRYTGVTCFYDQMASKLITAVDPATNTVTLAEPLGAEARKIRDVDAQLPGIQVYLHTLKYQPFAPPGTAEFEATFGGWLQYLQFVLDFAVQQTGRDDFDVEIWNELSFGSSFLRIENYYEPDPTFPVDPVLAAQGKLNQRSADFLKANFPRLTVIDGFTNTNITANPRQEKTGGFDGQSYHPYSASRERIPATWPQAVDRNLFREGWPPPGDWTFAFPEGQQSTNLRLQNLPRNQLYPLRRVSFYPRALAVPPARFDPISQGVPVIILTRVMVTARPDGSVRPADNEGTPVRVGRIPGTYTKDPPLPRFPPRERPDHVKPLVLNPLRYVFRAARRVFRVRLWIGGRETCSQALQELQRNWLYRFRDFQKSRDSVGAFGNRIAFRCHGSV